MPAGCKARHSLENAANHFAIRDLVAPGCFLLIGRGRPRLVEAARAVADQTGLPLDAIRLGHLDGDVLDPQCTWARHRETGADAAVLARPDRFVAWCRPGAAAEPARELTAALGEVLGRPLHPMASGPAHVMA